MKETASGYQLAWYASVSHNGIKSILKLKGDFLIKIEFLPEFKLWFPNTDEHAYTAPTDRKLYKCVEQAGLSQIENSFYLIGRTTRLCSCTDSHQSPCFWYTLPVYCVNLLASKRHGGLYNSGVARERFVNQGIFLSVAFVWKEQLLVALSLLTFMAFSCRSWPTKKSLQKASDRKLRKEGEGPRDIAEWIV